MNKFNFVAIVLGLALIAQTTVHADSIEVNTSDIDITTTNGVGINATTIDDELDVVGTAQITGNVVLGSQLDVTGATDLSSTLDVAGEATFDDMVGIGTSSPEEDLHVSGTARIATPVATPTSSATLNLYQTDGNGVSSKQQWDDTNEEWEVSGPNTFDPPTWDGDGSGASTGVSDKAPGAQILAWGKNASGGEFRQRSAITFENHATGSNRGGQIAMWTRPNSSGATNLSRVFSVDPAGEITLHAGFYDGCDTLGTNGGSEIVCDTSSARFKDNISDYYGGLDLVKQLKPVTYDYIEGYGRSGTQIGFVAEEVAEVEPALTLRDKDGLVNAVRYRLITALLVNAIKEQQARIEELERRLGM